MLRALVFDLYGTLLDIGSLRERLAAVAPDARAFVDTWRAKQLSYAFASSLIDRYADFDELTAHAFDYAVATHDAKVSPEARATLINAWSRMPAYADVVPAVAALRVRGVALGVLSNGTPRALEQTLSAAKIRSHFDAVLSVDTVRVYKPSPAVYQLAVDRFGGSREQIGFVSSNGWDATGAAEFGLTVFWCNRSGAPAETFGAKPAHTIRSLADIAAYL